MMEIDFFDSFRVNVASICLPLPESHPHSLVLFVPTIALRETYAPVSSRIRGRAIASFVLIVHVS